MTTLNVEGRGSHGVRGKRLILSGKDRVAVGSEGVETVPLFHTRLSRTLHHSLANNSERTRCLDAEAPVRWICASFVNEKCLLGVCSHRAPGCNHECDDRAIIV